MNTILLTTSWDDGHPLDLRVAELLAKYGLQGTFYVPLENREGLPVLSNSQLRHLGCSFEVGSHTATHCYLNSVDSNTAQIEILEGKRGLEDILGKAVPGFSYPGGIHTPALIELVRKAGFHYARTIQNFRMDVSDNPFALPVTLQFYPHKRPVFVRNFLSKGNWAIRYELFRALLAESGSLPERLQLLLDHASRKNQTTVLHFWGHSWEIAQLDAWDILEQFFDLLSQTAAVKSVTNEEIANLSSGADIALEPQHVT